MGRFGTAVPRAGSRHSAAGLSLVELLVAVTILALATLIAMAIYDDARRSYKIGENMTEQQQAVRIAFDLMVSDIRMAGFNTNPDGNKSRPDEQIETILPGAVTVRADYDGGDPTRNTVPEQALAGGAFLSVSTGNDEIYTYVLAKADGSSTDSVTFDADTAAGPRDGVVETVTIPDVALTHPSPPYTLYRYRLQDDGSPTPTPLIENVRSLRFRYFDSSGVELPYVGGADAPGDVELRRAVRRVSVELEALTRDPDPRFIDASDSDPTTRRFRKFKLTGDVTPRNLGMVGIRDFLADVTAPQQPLSAPLLYTGHCDGLYVAWDPNPPEDETAYYRVQYTDPSNVTDWLATDKTSAYLGGLQNGLAYTVAIQAVDAAGNSSPPSPSSVATTFNEVPDNVPRTPLNMTSTNGLNGRVDLSWSSVSNNAGPTFGDPDSPMLRDMAGYRVYRSETPGFTPGPSTLIADESALPGLPQPAHSDLQVTNCQPYHYVVSAVDRCQVESAMTPELTGSAWSNILPKAPSNVFASRLAPTTVRLTWLGVNQDINGNAVHISNYNVFRTAPVLFSTDPLTLTPADFSLIGVASGIEEFYDYNVVHADNELVYHIVTAGDACSPPNESVPSAPVAANLCKFAGLPEFQSPSPGSVVSGMTSLTVAVTGGSGTELYSQLRLNFVEEFSGASVQYSQAMTGPQATYSWDADPQFNPPFFNTGVWRVTAEVDQFLGAGPSVCTSSVTARFTVQ